MNGFSGTLRLPLCAGKCRFFKTDFETKGSFQESKLVVHKGKRMSTHFYIQRQGETYYGKATR